MPEKTDIELDIFEKNYLLSDNRSITVYDIKSPEDSNFYFQLRFIKKNSQKINLSQLEFALKNRIDKINANSKLCLNKKKELLNDLKKLDFDLRLTEIIYEKTIFKIDNQSNLTKQYNTNLIALFCLDSSENFNFGYEIPKNISEHNAPLCCVSIFSNKKLTKKIFLFPSNAQSLTDTVATLKNRPSIDLESLEIPYVEYLPFKPEADKEIQTRINLQTTISEILAHLEKPKYFRKNGSKKVSIFKELYKMIGENKPLTEIETKLDSSSKLEILSKHRDPWGFFAFFKGETNSAIAWKELGKIISEYTQSAIVGPSSSLSNN